jgi:sortase A
MWISRIETFSSRQKAGLILILVGLVCFGVIVSLKAYQEFRQKTLSFSKVPELRQEAPESLFPTRILITKVKIDLPVFEAKASGDIWEISEKGISYLLGSGVPGRKGNVVIYGHNKNNLFGPIRWLEKGDEIKLTNKMEEEFVYKVVETKTVSPQKVEVLSPTQDSTLTLYTCTGFLDKERFIVVAKLQVE